MAAVLSWQACWLRENVVEQFHSKSVLALIIAFLTAHMKTAQSIRMNDC